MIKYISVKRYMGSEAMKVLDNKIEKLGNDLKNEKKLEISAI